jgi:hypothetical protein
MTAEPCGEALGGSFRDPSGFVFRYKGVLYRQIQQSYRENYDHLMTSGLYTDLVEVRLLVPHNESDVRGDDSKDFYKTIVPDAIPFVSYPYEWSFSQLKDAALVTLDIQKRALRHGMSLVDASAYNIQFHGYQPVLIDTLSFRMYKEGEPWTAYRQFCQHFLAPLALMSLRDIRLSQLLRIYIDGVPLDLASNLLPLGTKLRFPLLLHIHVHAKSQKRYSAKPTRIKDRKMSRRSFLGLIDSLESAIRRLSWKPQGTEWADYYQDTNYSTSGLEHKTALVSEYLKYARPRVIWDMGGNVGHFSRIGARMGALTISFDVDPACVERNYLQCVEEKQPNLLPLLTDLTNPSPGMGWENAERTSLLARGPADAVMALALVHHLCISNNVPLRKVARFFSRLARFLIIEFVPKEDSQVQRLLATREDIFQLYNRENFEEAFREFFLLGRSDAIRDSRRTIYLMEKK